MFLFQHFHCNCLPDEDVGEEEIDKVGNNDEINESADEEPFDWIDAQQEDDEELTSSIETEVDNEGERKKKVWFEKVETLVHHMRSKNVKLVHTLGTLLSFDEMMIRCVGRSNETHRIKNKPIGQGYKLFCLTTSNGFCVNFTPDGRAAEKKGEQEYDKNDTKGKIQSMVLHVTDIVSHFRDKQKKRVWNKERATRGNKTNVFDELYSGKYVITMDNYFTSPKVIKSLRDRDIGVVGTARFKKTWPPQCLKQINSETVKFNDFYWMVDDDGTMLGRWMDNNFVFMVSTVHRIGKTIERVRRKPRKTAKNCKHVDEIWGNKGKNQSSYLR